MRSFTDVTKYTVGDAVSYRGAFLRSVGWYTNVPRRGVVVAIKPFARPSDLVILDVQWSDGFGLMSVNARNVMLAGVPDYS
jgi:hypothetical protein